MNPQDLLAYKALYRWAERFNAWEYHLQMNRNRGKKLKTFIPNSYSEILISAMKELCNGSRSAKEAMSLLNTVEGITEKNHCIESGF